MKFERVDLRKTHPTLYRSVIVYAFISIALGFNFWLANPTFNPYEISKEIIGTIFIIIGVTKLLAISVIRSLLFVRFSMGLCMVYMMWWGIGTSITFFTGQTSLQLFILYSGLNALQMLFLLEPYVNPLTASVAGTKNKRYVDRHSQ